mmetsp:Transcript_12192/g.51350  ORF Transcript_12192/g.51350 Transcript_12192/m.51350 type:complete len:236 (+) Transcript_12192:228-935(+)
MRGQSQGRPRWSACESPQRAPPIVTAARAGRRVRSLTPQPQTCTRACARWRSQWIASSVWPRGRPRRPRSRAWAQPRLAARRSPRSRLSKGERGPSPRQKSVPRPRRRCAPGKRRGWRPRRRRASQKLRRALRLRQRHGSARRRGWRLRRRRGLRPKQRRGPKKRRGLQRRRRRGPPPRHRPRWKPTTFSGKGRTRLASPTKTRLAQMKTTAAKTSHRRCRANGHPLPPFHTTSA